MTESLHLLVSNRLCNCVPEEKFSLLPVTNDLMLDSNFVSSSSWKIFIVLCPIVCRLYT
uniref:Uncharacterized protein n=1 Tax=Rhizophora mucronata TaxID=61149 RepID=A0A2P2N885_RHIMU